MDSIPLVCLTGQVPTSLIGSDAFQECDTVGITRPCTKHNWLVKDVNELAAIIHEAFHVATTGRPGPVVVDIPKDVQFAKGIYTPPQTAPRTSYQPKVQGDLDKIKAAVELMAAAQAADHLFRRRRHQFRPGGQPAAARTGRPHRLPDHLDADGARRLSGVAARTGSACSACTAPTKPTWRCMIATSWSASARASTTASPAGSTRSRRTRRRSTSTSTRPRSTRTCAPTSPIIGDVGRVLEDMVRLWRATAKADKKALYPWWEQIARWRARDSLAYRTNDDVIMPQYAVQRLYELTKDTDTYITTEVGQHQMWAAQHYPFREAEPLDDLGRPRHDGLRPAGRARRADRASRRAGHRHRRRRLGADDHAGDELPRCSTRRRSRSSS